jgi:hypothetical protein
LTHLRNLEEEEDEVLVIRHEDVKCVKPGWDVIKKICCGDDLTPYDANN